MSVDFEFKIALIGDPNAGKTSFLRHAIQIQHRQSLELPVEKTIGVDYQTLVFTLDKSEIRVRLKFYDLSGDNIYYRVRQSYYSSAQAFLLLYDSSVSIKDELDIVTQCQHWNNEIDNCLRHMSSTKVLIGYTRNASTASKRRKKVLKFAHENGFCLYYELARDDAGLIRELFSTLCMELIGNFIRFLTHQMHSIDLYHEQPQWFTYQTMPVWPVLDAKEPESDDDYVVYFDCKRELLNIDFVVFDCINAKRKNLQQMNFYLFDQFFF